MDGLLRVFLLLALATAVWLLLRPALPHLKGRIGGWRVHFVLKRALPASHYTVFHDITLRPGRAENGPTTHIDHVVVSPYGVFVIETRHYSGCIFGSERDPHWTRVRFRSKQKFQNPLRQNPGHVRALQELSGLDASCFHPLVVFTGSAEFRTPMPARVTQLGGLVPFIQVRTHELIGFDEAQRVSGLLESSRLPPGRQTAAAHLAALRESHGKRFSAKQAVLGLGLMAALLIAAGSLVHELAEMPGQYTSSGGEAAPSPFAERARPPRIALPERAGRPRPTEPAAVTTVADVRQPAPVAGLHQGGRRQAVTDKWLAGDSSLMCAYAAESRRCACYDPQGRKADLDYGECRMLADRATGSPPR
ncbi:MAG: NERD domain-containing protein [Xanthomonadales bacterium]|nr:NERD domain-containing protein [Xanthomonadales bacterium]